MENQLERYNREQDTKIAVETDGEYTTVTVIYDDYDDFIPEKRKKYDIYSNVIGWSLVILMLIILVFLVYLIYLMRH